MDLFLKTLLFVNKHLFNQVYDQVFLIPLIFKQPFLCKKYHLFGRRYIFEVFLSKRIRMVSAN